MGSGSHAEQTGRIMAGVEKILIEEEPDVVLVQGDTNTVMAGALAASKLHIRVGHVEAGLRSFDRNMPEEINRVVADHVSDYCFAPTETAKGYLLKEGIDEAKIYVTGNTIFPVHPRTRKMVKEFGLEFDGIRAIEPVGFLEFLQLESNARLALTDSGGVQEETCILGVPC